MDEAPTTVQLVALAGHVRRRCLGAGVRLGTAESCTGGLVGHVLTETPGASDYYVGGIVSYSDQVKGALLGVAREVLERHGAVSAQTAVAMAGGARHRLGCDIAVAVTGIAGPDGGTAAKPVGLTYVAVADAAGQDARRFLWTGDRAENKRSSAAAALTLLLERLGRVTATAAPGEGSPSERA